MRHLVVRSVIEEKILDLIEAPIKKMGFEVVRIRYLDKSDATLQIMIDQNSNKVEIDDCANISTTVSTLLDVDDPLSESYTLEVSSPGINRPLTRKKDFQIWEGYCVKIKTYELISGRKTFSGVLLGIKNEEILVKMMDKTIGLHVDWINEAHLSISMEKILQNNKKEKSEPINLTKFDNIEIEKS